MKGIIRIAAIALTSVAMICIPLTANADRHQGARGGGRPGVTASRGGNHGNHGGKNDRPGKNHDKEYRPGKNDRPGKNHDKGYRPGKNDRPGKNHDKGYRPDKNDRPGKNHDKGYRPGKNDRPGWPHDNGYHNGHRPGHGPSHGYRPPKPHHKPNYGWRPGRMPRPYYRPTPPPRWRPAPGIPPIGAILGLTFGAAFDASMNYLLNSYAVSAYNNSILMVQNAPYLNFVWPEARLIYNNGYLDGTQFIYTSPYADNMRYYSTYNYLTNIYGMPVQTGPGMVATWYGANRGFINLSFEMMNGRYFTVLSLGR